MQKNVGGIDRIARLVVGPILILSGIAGYAGMLALAVGPLSQALASVIAVLVGTILLITGLVQRCPLNRVIGLDTFRQKTPPESEDPSATNQR